MLKILSTISCIIFFLLIAIFPKKFIMLCQDFQKSVFNRKPGQIKKRHEWIIRGIILIGLIISIIKRIMNK